MTTRIWAALWMLSLTATSWLTWDYAAAKADQERMAAVSRAIEQQQALDDETRDLEEGSAEQAQQVRIVYRDRVKKVIEYVEKYPDRVQCFDDKRLQLFNAIAASVENADGDPVREVDPPVD